jgi:uncharacterized protein (TIGR03435 family)
MLGVEALVKRFIVVILTVVFSQATIFAQAPSAARSFEAVSIRPAETITPTMIASGKVNVGMSIVGKRVNIGYVSLADLIPIAFRVKPYQVSGPDWISSQRFDIIGTLPEGASQEQVPDMLQTLLTERFQLSSHRETREYSTLALSVGKGELKLRESVPEKASSVDPTSAQGGVNSQLNISRGTGTATVGSQQTGATKMSMGPNGIMRMEMSKVTMQTLADMLTRILGRPVIDMTELKGDYQVALDLSMPDLAALAKAAGMTTPAAAPDTDPSRPVQASDPSTGSSVLSSLQQLGLNLESRKVPLDVLVVDQALKIPTPN